MAPLNTRGSLLTAREYLGSFGDKKVAVRCRTSCEGYVKHVVRWGCTCARAVPVAPLYGCQRPSGTQLLSLSPSREEQQPDRWKVL